MLFSTLAAKLKVQLRPFDLHMLAAQGSQAKGLVFFGIFFVADADKAYLEEFNHRGQHFISRQAGQLEISCHATANPRERVGEGDHVKIFGFIAHFTPALVVAMLLAPARVSSGGLEMTIRERT